MLLSTFFLTGEVGIAFNASWFSAQHLIYHTSFQLKHKCIWEGNKKSTKQITAKEIILLF